jgi:hypothetical protein
MGGGRFRWYQSRRLAVGRDPRSETPFQALELIPIQKFSAQTLTTGFCLVPDGWQWMG